MRQIESFRIIIDDDLVIFITYGKQDLLFRYLLFLLLLWLQGCIVTQYFLSLLDLLQLLGVRVEELFNDHGY